MNPPAAIDTVLNRIARREAFPAGRVDDFDTALPPLRFQSRGEIPHRRIQLSSSRRKLKLTGRIGDLPNAACACPRARRGRNDSRSLLVFHFQRALAHRWPHQIQALKHTVRLTPVAYVKPYLV
jgi:hypothetical protein